MDAKVIDIDRKGAGVARDLGKGPQQGVLWPMESASKGARRTNRPSELALRLLDRMKKGKQISEGFYQQEIAALYSSVTGRPVVQRRECGQIECGQVEGLDGDPWREAFLSAWRGRFEGSAVSVLDLAMLLDDPRVAVARPPWGEYRYDRALTTSLGLWLKGVDEVERVGRDRMTRRSLYRLKGART